jgi:LuxR family maltose regulon positive regulatory protein
LLLTTKFHTPPARPNLVARARLFERLQAGLMGKLTLIAAPAGFGKTTLLSAWRATETGGALPFAWVSLDSLDDDPFQFWTYVIAAIDTLAPGIGATPLTLLQSPQPPPLERILTGVLNAFSVLPLGVAVLVLDDYHVITAPAIHGVLAWLLDHLPPNLHLVILTRSDPALPLARLRARGAMTEVRANDLRFTPDEAAIFLNQTMGLSLTAADVAALEARTEGWIAGLQLAALAMRDHRDRSGFIRAFNGNNRYIVDYLAAEVLASQPSHIHNFLLSTAILDRMCGPLCDAVIGAETGDWEFVAKTPRAGLSASSRLLLEELEHTNLFVVPLDDDRQWYRYHHLFAEVLRQHLANSTPAEEIATLHGRASVWYERQGLVIEAMHHAQMAADQVRIAHLIEQHGLRIIVAGQVQILLGWLSTLPEALLRTHPLLCTIHALALLFTNQLEAAEARIRDAESCIHPNTPAAEAQIIQGRAAAIRANIARYTGDLAGSVALGQQVLRLLPESETIARTTARLHLARAFRVSGDVRDEVEARAVAVVAPFRAANHLLGTLAAITNLARLRVLQGRLHAAAATFGEMAQIAAEPDQPLLLEGPAYYVGMGDLLREWNDLDAAEQHLAQAMEQLEGRLVVDAEDVTLGYLARARLQHARGEYTTAHLTLESYLDLARRRGFVTHLLARAAAVQAHFALAEGNFAVAVAWADTNSLNALDELHFVRETEYLVLARVWIARAGNDPGGSWLQQTLHLLERLLEDATTKARMGSVLEILLVRALALWAQEARSHALATVVRALRLAAPEGYIRRFVDEGMAMMAMLRHSAAHEIAPDYRARLLAAFPATLNVQPGVSKKDLPVQRSEFSIEPLSQRELEVIRLIADGKSNGEIAQTLMIALSTVKTHTNSIFSKWQVTSRTQAIARARELQLL